MLPIKIDLTKELATKLRELRINNPINGEVLTAENLSKAIGNNRAWMSQIESRRLKKIKREDIIAIYKLLFNISSDQEAEEQAELELIEYIAKNPRSRKTTIVAPDKIINDKDNTFSKYYLHEKPSTDNPDVIFRKECDEIHNYFLSLYKEAVSAEEKTNLCTLLSALSYTITHSDTKTLKLISEISFQLFRYVPEDECQEIYDRAKNLSLSLEKYAYHDCIDLYNKNITFIKDSINNRFTFYSNALMPLINYSFSLLISLVYNNSYPISIQDKITLINDFISLSKILSSKYNIEFSVDLLNYSSEIETLKETINLIQSFINSIPKNNAYYMSKSSDYFE